MRDDPSVAALVARAANGDKQAWDELVERYAPLVWSICRYQLGHADAGAVGRSVWLQLVDRLAALPDPAALPRRARCLDKMRRCPATAALINALSERCANGARPSFVMSEHRAKHPEGST